MRERRMKINKRANRNYNLGTATPKASLKRMLCMPTGGSWKTT